jgi:uncharacterized protein YbjQ (UPF0145 family)
MTCPLCGTGVLPGKVCLYCGYDPKNPDAKPAVHSEPKPLVKESAFKGTSMSPAVKKPVAKKTARTEPQEAEGPPAGSEHGDLLEEVDRLSASAALASPSALTTSPQKKTTLQQSTVAVTTQPSFEGQRIEGYVGLVASTVVARVGALEELLPYGQEIQRLSGGPIGLRLRKAINLALADLKTEALESGANGVVGARLEVSPGHGPFAIVTLVGTAVILET